MVPHIEGIKFQWFHTIQSQYLVPTAQLEKNVIKEATKQHKDKQLYKRENIKETDEIEGGRSTRSGREINKYDRHLDKLDQNLGERKTNKV